MRIAAVMCTLLVLVAPAAPVSAAPMQRPGDVRPLGPRVDVNGNPASPGVWNLSGDGRIALLSTAAPLVASDTNGHADVYAYEIATGATDLVSVATTGDAANGASGFAVASHDGRYVLFISDATDLVVSDANGTARDAFVRDRETSTTVLVSVSTAGIQANAATIAADLSDDGRVVAFLSSADNVVAGDTNQFSDVFVHDLDGGQTERVSVTTDGVQAVFAAEGPSISGDGSVVAFASPFPFVADDTNAPSRDVYVHDRNTGRTERVSLSSAGTEGPLASFYANVSYSGRYVAFSSFNPSYVPYDTNGFSESFVHDRETGVTERIVGPDGRQLNHVVGVPLISADGRYVTANFLPDNVGYDDANGSTDVYRVDRLTGAVDLVSATPAGTAGNAISYSPVMSGDGRLIAFISEASDLVPGLSKGAFIRDLGPAIGVGSLTASNSGDNVTVAGWVRIAAAPFTSAEDRLGDGGSVPGSDLVAARVTYRPEERDILFSADFIPGRHVWPPLIGTDAAKPGLATYVVRFALDGVRYQARAIHGVAGQTFPVYRCAPTCDKIGDATGGVGTASDRVMVAVPQELLGDVAGAPLTGVTVGAATGDDGTGVLRVWDEMSVPQAVVPRVSVEVAVSRDGEHIDELAFQPVTLSNGRFSETVAADADANRIVVRTCAGSVCTVASTAP